MTEPSEIVECQSCGQRPEVHRDSDAGPMTVCPEFFNPADHCSLFGVEGHNAYECRFCWGLGPDPLLEPDPLSHFGSIAQPPEAPPAD